MPVGPKELSTLTDEDKRTIAELEKQIDNALLSEYRGSTYAYFYLSRKPLKDNPLMHRINDNVKREIINKYMAAGWSKVEYESKREDRFSDSEYYFYFSK